MLLNTSNHINQVVLMRNLLCSNRTTGRINPRNKARIGIISIPAMVLLPPRLVAKGNLLVGARLLHSGRETEVTIDHKPPILLCVIVSLTSLFFNGPFPSPPCIRDRPKLCVSTGFCSPLTLRVHTTTVCRTSEFSNFGSETGSVGSNLYFEHSDPGDGFTPPIRQELISDRF